MPDTIELVDSTMNFNDGPFSNRVVVYLGNTSVKYPNILCKTPSEVPKNVLLKGGTKKMQTHFQICKGDGSTMSAEQSTKLVEQISQQMRKEGFFNCTFELKGFAAAATRSKKPAFGRFSSKIKANGKPATVAMSGAQAMTRGNNDINFGKASPQQQLLGHELIHVVQQK